MIVVADTSPLNDLILIGNIDLLPALYKLVVIPPAVREELSHKDAPAAVRQWIADQPLWLQVREPLSLPGLLSPNLDSGEREAICVALDTKPHLILIDEAAGREAAESVDLPVIGTLGVLTAASRKKPYQLGKRS